MQKSIVCGRLASNNDRAESLRRAAAAVRSFLEPSEMSGAHKHGYPGVQVDNPEVTGLTDLHAWTPGAFKHTGPHDTAA